MKESSVSFKATLVLLIISHFFVLVSCIQSKKNTLLEQPIYKVHKAKNSVIIDGEKGEDEWGNSITSLFEYTYLDKMPSDRQKTKYSMLWDNEHIYLFFECEDKFITAKETQRDGTPFLDDCAELFITPVPEALNMHICFEVNLNKAINDIVYINDFYKGNFLSVKGYNPDIKVGIQINGTVNDNSDIDKGWTMEFAIPKEAFKGAEKYFPMQLGTKWTFLALRQDRNEIESNRRVVSTLFHVENIKEKGVHQPVMFGLLEFVE